MFKGDDRNVLVEVEESFVEVIGVQVRHIDGINIEHVLGGGGKRWVVIPATFENAVCYPWVTEHPSAFLARENSASITNEFKGQTWARTHVFILDGALILTLSVILCLHAYGPTRNASWRCKSH